MIKVLLNRMVSVVNFFSIYMVLIINSGSNASHSTQDLCYSAPLIFQA